VVRSYRTDAARHVIWAAAPFVWLLAYGVWLDSQGLLGRWLNSSFAILPVAALLVLSIGVIASTAAVGGSEVLRLHASGMFDVRAGLAVRWDEVRTLCAARGDPGRRPGSVLTTSNGARVHLGVEIADLEHLVDEIEARMVQRALPELWRRVTEGGSARFGVLLANADGLTLGARRIAWSEIGRIRARNAEVVIGARTRARWATVPLYQVPNACVLLAMWSRFTFGGSAAAPPKPPSQTWWAT
jgi:hypothetical protein